MGITIKPDLTLFVDILVILFASNSILKILNGAIGSPRSIQYGIIDILDGIIGIIIVIVVIIF